MCDTDRGMQAGGSAFALVQDIVFDFIRFPLWWYTEGVRRAARFAWSEIRGWAQRLSLIILVRNMFKPMYGDYTRTGRAISLFLRLIIFVVKVVMMVIWVGVVLLLFIAWLALPPVLVTLFIRALVGGYV